MTKKSKPRRQGCFVFFEVMSFTQNEVTKERIVDQFEMATVADNIVGANPLDMHAAQAHPDIKSIIYFAAGTGLRPMLSTCNRDDIIDVVIQARKQL